MMSLNCCVHSIHKLAPIIFDLAQWEGLVWGHKNDLRYSIIVSQKRHLNICGNGIDIIGFWLNLSNSKLIYPRESDGMESGWIAITVVSLGIGCTVLSSWSKLKFVITISPGKGSTVVDSDRMYRITITVSPVWILVNKLSHEIIATIMSPIEVQLEELPENCIV